jgi:hypothetical protein
VVLEHHVVALGLGGLRTRLQQRQVLATGSEAGRGSWREALQVLAAALGEAGSGPCVATAILANSLVRYVLVPGSNLLNPDQAAAVLRHCFQETFGEAAEQWALRISEAPGVPLQVACGIDQELLESLRALFPDRRRRLRSIQPRLMAVCNQHRAALGAGPAWLLLVEPGHLCLGLIAAGSLVRLRNLRGGDDWAGTLPELLDREACLAELEAAPGELLLWLRDRPVPTVAPDGALRLRLLEDPLPLEPAAGGGTLAMAGG